MIRRIIIAVAVATASFAGFHASGQSPLSALAERVAPGAASRFEFHRNESADSVYFRLGNLPDGRIAVEGNDNVSLAVGLNHYFRNYLHQQVSWANPVIELPDTLPAVAEGEWRSTTLPWRYYLNYCTHSYSMAFWDWARWQQEIDWMALHGINLPLAATGMEAVWRDALRSLGYPKERIAEYIAGPGYQAWWLMNNLEGWGGPVDNNWIEGQSRLQKQILARMRELDMSPVLPGYSGMVPHDARETLGLDVADPGLWCAYPRPAFLLPTDKNFQRVAQAYYQALTSLYGKASHYSMDPFHEGGNTEGVDLQASGAAILEAMHRESPEAVWVIQGWQGNPRAEMIDSIPAESMLILDLWSESAPQWRTPLYGTHPRIQCLLLNYGGNVGMHGKMRHTVDEFAASAAPGASTSPLAGVGATMEGIENNEVMYTLMFDLPWHPEIYASAEGLDDWLDSWAASRYGTEDGTDSLRHAWHLLERSIYNCPAASRQQGTTESLFCARPSIDVKDASSWANATMYWNPADVAAAERAMASAAAPRSANQNYLHDLTDLRRQVRADRGRLTFDSIKAAAARADTAALAHHSAAFLQLILEQDSLLSTRPEFDVATWIAAARRSAEIHHSYPDLNEWNARTLITTWGNREAANRGGLHDYGNKEWAGLLREFYYPRWELWLRELNAAVAAGKSPADIDIDWFSIEQPWTVSHVHNHND